MANNYLEFSEVINDLTPDEMKWWETQEKNIAETYANESSWPDDYEPWNDLMMCEDFHVIATEKTVWFHADESGDIEKVAHIIKKFLQTFRPQECFTLTWAASCSKPRVGEFHGGAIFVTRRFIKFNDSWKWINQQREKWQTIYRNSD